MSVVIRRAVRRLQAGGSARALWLFAAQVLASGTAFVVNILAARALSPAHRGDLALYLQLGYLVSLALLVGIETPFVAHVTAGFSDSVREFLHLRRAGTWLLPVALCAGLAWSFGGQFDPLVAVAVVVFALTNVYVRAIRAAYVASGSIRAFASGTIGVQVVILGLTITLGLGRVGSTMAWFGAYLVANLVAVGICVAAVLRARARDRLLAAAETRLVRSQGWRLLPASFTESALVRSDRLMLPLLSSSAQLGYYIVVSAALEVAVWPTAQWVDTKLNEWTRDAERMTIRFVVRQTITVTVFLCAIAAALSVFVWAVIEFFLPPAYDASTRLILPLAVSVVLFGVTRLHQALLVAQSAGGRVSIIDMVGLVLSLALFAVLIPIWGALGAALGAACGNLLSLVITAWFLLRIVRRVQAEPGVMGTSTP